MVIDAALDGIVQLGWLGKELAPDKRSFDGGLGLAEIALVTTPPMD